ncbi:MAG: DUF3858 domain-containing protein [Nonlabens sp.]
MNYIFLNKRITLLLLLVASMVYSKDYSAQKIDSTYGAVSMNDFKISNPELTGVKKSQVIYRKVTIDFKKIGKFIRQVRTVHERIKINDEQGLEYATNQTLLYIPSKFSKQEYDVRGQSYNILNGDIIVTKMDESSLFQEQVTKNVQQMSFTMPEVRVGTIIEYEYSVTSLQAYIQDIVLQYDIPILRQDIYVYRHPSFTFKATLNPLAAYVPHFEILPKPKLKSKRRKKRGLKKNAKMRGKLENTPALVLEPFSGTRDRVRAKLIFERNTSSLYGKITSKKLRLGWYKIAHRMLLNPNFGVHLDQTSFARKDLKKIDLKALSKTERLDSILGFVQSKIKWNGYMGKYSRKGTKEAYQSGSGDVAEVNLFLAAVLRREGFHADPVIISSKENGIPSPYSEWGFNYVIVQVEEGNNSYLMDATCEHCPKDILPYRARNFTGNVIMEGDSIQIISIPNKKSKQQLMVNASLNIANETASCTVARRDLVYKALTSRNSLDVKTQEKQKEYLEDGNDNVKVIDYSIENLKNPSQPLKLNYKVDYADAFQEIGDKLYISPLLFESSQENPFKLEKRNFAVELPYPMKNTSIVNITIPDGYEVETIPDSQKFVYNDGIGSYTYTIAQSQGMITTSATFELNDYIISTQDYPMFREFFMSIINKDSEKVVLKRKNEH